MGQKLVIADDDPAIRDVFKIIFETAGYEVEIKENGNDLIKNRFRLPDLFLIDRLLSGLDGLDICKHLKKQQATKNIPVIIISASPDTRQLAKLAGADGFIEKPFRVSNLLEIVHRFIKK